MKKIVLVIFAGILLGWGAASADEFEFKPRIHDYPIKPGAAKSDSAHEYDVLKYQLAVSLPMTNDSLYGHQNILAVRKLSGDSLTVDCVRLDVDSVKLDGSHTGFSLSADTLSLTAGFASVGLGQSFNLEIFYRGGNFIKNGDLYKGYYWFPKGYNAFTLHTVGYSMSEPQDARRWMPCFDQPWDKADSGCTTSITLPDSFAAASNGLLMDTVRSGDQLTWRWQEESAITTYLMCFTASRFSIWTDTARLVSGRAIPLNYFVWPEDSALSRSVFATVPQMVRLYDSLFHPYPFGKYGMAAVYPFYYGGMEHQTMTTIHRSWITGNAQRGIAHELAHMWFGDMITCGAWADIWLNEGFASYLEAVYDERLNSRLPGIYMNQWFWRALTGNANVYPIYNPPPNLLFDASMVYYKGAWVLQGLRWVMGDSTFFAALNAYGDSFSYGNAITSDFQRITEQHYGSSLQWYFDQWVYRAGHPKYCLVTYYKTHPDSNSAQVKITQTSTTGELYKMPLALACSISAGIDSTVVVWDSLASQDFLVQDDQPVARVMLDPDSWVLKEWTDFLPVLTTTTTTSPSTIIVQWNRFTADTTIAGYNLYRSDDSTNGYIRLNQNIITDTCFTDSSAASCLPWYYAITAVNGADTCYETHQSNSKSGITGGVEGNPGDRGQVTTFSLDQNVPNPFKQSTMINYQLTKPGLTALKVYNIQGQLVKTLVNAIQSAGRYEAKWDGRDHSGQKVSSGIYIYCLNTDGRTFVKKMQYVR